MAVVMALMGMLLLLPLTAAHLALATSEQRIATNHMTQNQARATAESGTEWVLWNLQNDVEILTADVPIENQGSAHLVVTWLDPDHRHVVSTAQHRGATRVVQVIFQRDPTTLRWNLQPDSYRED